MNPRWLLRMKRFAQNPPSPAQIKFVAALIALCLLLFAIEQFFGWPEALTPNRMQR